ncbi:MAG: response regulator [Rhizomicrobium sp.]
MSGYHLEKLRILVVDDNVHMRKLVITILQALGAIHLLEAESGEKAWAVLAAQNPDVVILDWVMEDMSGLALARTIRTDPKAPNPYVPVIMLTGHTQTARVREARDAGINEFIAKPVSLKTLMSRLAAVIDNPRPYVRTRAYLGPCRRRRNLDYEGPERRATGTIQAAE